VEIFEHLLPVIEQTEEIVVKVEDFSSTEGIIIEEERADNSPVMQNDISSATPLIAHQLTLILAIVLTM